MNIWNLSLELPLKSVHPYDWIVYNPTVTSSYFKTASFKCILVQCQKLFHKGKQLSNWTDSVKYLYIVRSKARVLTTMKTAVFWNVMPCGLVGVDWHFRGTCCIYHLGRRVPITRLAAGIIFQKTTVLILSAMRASNVAGSNAGKVI